MNTPPKLPASLQANPRLSRWLDFPGQGRVTIRPGKVEIGQGILTALSQIAADELDVALSRIEVQTVATPDSPDEGVTSGSLSVQNSGAALRHVCAEARAIFLQVASQRSGLTLGDLRVEDGVFLGPGDLSTDMGHLGNMNHPDVQKVLDEAIVTIRKCGKAPGILTNDEVRARHYVDLGAQFITVGSDVSILARETERLASKYKAWQT